MLATHVRSRAAYVTAALALLRPGLALGEPTARFDDVTPEADARPAPPAAPARRPASVLPPAAGSAASWATRSAAALLRQGQMFERRGDIGSALRSYHDAIVMDSSHGPAYLALGRMREAQGDTEEAERIYTEALRFGHVPADALARRALLRNRLGRTAEAVRDLEAALQHGPVTADRARLMATWYAEQQAWPAALAIWRRLLDTLEASDDQPGIETARLQVRALRVLAAEMDPVTAPGHPSWVRRSMGKLELAAH